MLSSLLFGTAIEGPVDPPVPEGHRGVNVIIENQSVFVDVDALAKYSGLFLQVQSSTGEKECPLEDFPGGIGVFRQIVRVLINTGDQGSTPLDVGDGNVIDLIEAAWLLECPRIFDEVMDSPYMRSLSSRRKVEMLEHLLLYTAASTPSERDAVSQANGESPEEFLSMFLLETAMWQRTERAAVELATQLDAGDFVLGPRLATGSLRMSCQLLRLHERQHESYGLVSHALQPVNTLWKNLVDKPLCTTVSWDSHLFALTCMKKRLPGFTKDKEPSAGRVGKEEDEDNEAKMDLPDGLCRTVDDSVLLGFRELVEHIDIRCAPSNWTALLIRTLILNGREEKARSAFADAFPGSRPVQELAWRAPVVVPAVWLADVADHSEGPRVLLRVLESFRDMAAEEFCTVIEDVLLDHCLRSPHCAVVLASELINEIVGACFDAARKAEEGRSSSPASQRRCPRQWEGQHVLWRIEHVGTRLFEAAFVPQCGFLPHAWPDCLAGNPQDAKLDEGLEDEDYCCQLEPLVIEVTGNCLWDEGLLQINLLHEVMNQGRAVPHEPILHRGRQAILRHLWYTFDGSYCDIPRLHALWNLACWPLCEDARLIREALEYLKGTNRELLSPAGSWCPEHEEAVFRMFVALDLSRLPGQCLMSPWVPAQIQAIRLLVQQRPAEQIHSELQESVFAATESLKSVNVQCVKLSNKLNIVEQRTVINKSQINDSILAIEEHEKKQREAKGVPPRRAASTPSST